MTTAWRRSGPLVASIPVHAAASSKSWSPLLAAVTAPFTRTLAPSATKRLPVVTGSAAIASGSAIRVAVPSFEDLRLIAGTGLALNGKSLREGERFGAAHGGRHDPGGADARTGTIAENTYQIADALGQIRRQEVILVGDALVIESENVGEIGPPLDHLHGQVALRAGPPVHQFGFAGPAQQQGTAEAYEIAYAIQDAGLFRQI